MIALRNRRCPVCNSSERRYLHQLRLSGGRIQNGYNVVVCRVCGAGYADYVRAERELIRYYAEESKYTYAHSAGEESSWDFLRFKQIVGETEPYLPNKNIEILDIGCATGGLLSVFKAKGYLNLTGVDPSTTCAAAANRLYGIKVRVATVSSLSVWKRRFDLILLVGVLEHLGDPNSAIKILRRLLRPGGLLYCAVPDVQGFARCRNAPYQQFSLEHLNFFSQRTLSRIFLANEFDLVSSKRWKVEWRQGIQEPIVSGLFRHGDSSTPPFDPITERALKRYFVTSRKADSRIAARIKILSANAKPIYIWGAGTLARRLFAAGVLQSLNVISFIDSNIALRGKRLGPWPISDPTAISLPSPILLCTYAFEKEIAELIRHRYGLKNRLIYISH